MHRLKEVHVLRVIGPHLLELEPIFVGIERDQRLPGVGGEEMAVEREGHQLPASIFARRACSAALGCSIAKEPVAIGPAGS